MTPPNLAHEIVQRIDLENVHSILEPSCGQGVFLEAIKQQKTRTRDRQSSWKLVGIEIDPILVQDARRIEGARIYRDNFFKLFLERGPQQQDNPLNNSFDLVIGNPPFGGTFDHSIEAVLDRMLGERFGMKIKKETYAFFVVACTELLRPGGKLIFICSDSLLTIPTMIGLRNFLQKTGMLELRRISEFSEETQYPMIVLEYTRSSPANDILRFGERISIGAIEKTPNLSWGITPEISRLFLGTKLGDFFVASSGMTTGKNEYFVREIQPDGSIIEPYKFLFVEEPVSVEYEMERAQFNRLSSRRLDELRRAVARGETQRRILVELRKAPKRIVLPHDDYRPYNKANGSIVFSPPTHVIFWKDEGDAVLSYKKTGNWYLRGVGGQPYFGREGITWQLISSRFKIRYLPAGYILDSGAPLAVMRGGVDPNEMPFVLAWLLTALASRILKTTINHTMNIQSKDFERMPYPWWVEASRKEKIINAMQYMIERGKGGRIWGFSDDEIKCLDEWFDPSEASDETRSVILCKKSFGLVANTKLQRQLFV